MIIEDCWQRNDWPK